MCATAGAACLRGRRDNLWGCLSVEQLVWTRAALPHSGAWKLEGWSPAVVLRSVVWRLAVEAGMQLPRSAAHGQPCCTMPVAGAAGVWYKSTSKRGCAVRQRCIKNVQNDSLKCSGIQHGCVCGHMQSHVATCTHVHRELWARMHVVFCSSQGVWESSSKPMHACFLCVATH